MFANFAIALLRTPASDRASPVAQTITVKDLLFHVLEELHVNQMEIIASTVNDALDALAELRKIDDILSIRPQFTRLRQVSFTKWRLQIHFASLSHGPDGSALPQSAVVPPSELGTVSELPPGHAESDTIPLDALDDDEYYQGPHDSFGTHSALIIKRKIHDEMKELSSRDILEVDVKVWHRPGW